MRHIRRNHLAFPAGWREKAEKAFKDVKDFDCDERAKEINKRNDVWKGLKEELQKLSHDKCWYCESLTTPTAPGDVDHFRPKNAVEKCPNHSGYWWLAFDWANYRYSCENCNRPNKAKHFPLVNETKRVFDVIHAEDVMFEEPMLLDPVEQLDTRLLSFDIDGFVQPAKSKQQDPMKYMRAKRSIEIYHLNRSKLQKARQFLVCNEVMRLIEEGKRYLRLQEKENSRAALSGYTDVINKLSEMIAEDAQYSAAAKAILNLHRRELSWVDELLNTA